MGVQNVVRFTKETYQTYIYFNISASYNLQDNVSLYTLL